MARPVYNCLPGLDSRLFCWYHGTMTAKGPLRVFKQNPLRRKSALLAFIFIFWAFPTLYAQSKTMGYRFIAEKANAELEDALYYSLAVEWADSGFSSVKTDTGAEYLLMIEYDDYGDYADVIISLLEFDSAARERASVSDSLVFDETFDHSVSTLVSRLEAAAFPSGIHASETEGPATISGVFSSEMVRTEDLLRSDRPRRLELAVSAGSPVYIGDFSGYSTYGAIGSFQAGILFLQRKWGFSVGARFSSAYAVLLSDVTGGPVFFCTAAPYMQVGLGAVHPIRLAGGLSAGAAFVSVGEGFMTKTDPYLDGSIQFGFPVRKDLFIGADIRAVAIFEPSLPVYGLVFGLSAAREF